MENDGAPGAANSAHGGSASGGLNHKSVYFAQRNPALGERFRPRWRRHGALGMSLPTVWGMLRRYAHYDPVIDPPPALGVTAQYDAIGANWFVSADVFSAAQNTDAMEAMRRDELETFATLIRKVNFLCTETVLKHESAGLFMVFVSVDRGDGVDDFAFAVALTDGFAADLLGRPDIGPKVVRLAVCLRSVLAKTMGAGRQHDGLLELSFRSLEDAVAVFSSDAYAAVAHAHRAAVREVERCATRELLLDDIDLYD